MLSRLIRLGFLCFTTSVIAAEPVMQLPSGWNYDGITHDAPSHRFYDSIVAPIKDGSTYLVWYRAEFLQPQNSKEGKYLAEAMLLEIACKAQTYEVRRDIRYDAAGKVIWDHASPEGVNLHHYREQDLGGEIDTGALPLDESFFVLAFTSGDTCMKSLDD